jgi:hypothetical protein
MQVAYERGPMVHLKGKDGSLPVREPANPRLKVDEDARSVHTDRHYDKSARSNKSQERSVKSTASDRQSVNSRRSQNLADTGSQRSLSQHKSASPASANSGSYVIQRLTSSLVSNPDNLICDDCINGRIKDGHRERALQAKNIDKEHADRTNANLRRQLEEEKLRHLAKLKLYRDGIDDQNQDLIAKKAKMRLDEEAEKQKIIKQLADRSDIIATEQMMFERKEKFRAELSEQLVSKDKERSEIERRQLEFDRAQHNLLIDDAWRAPHKQALRNHYKENLINQMSDNDRAKQEERDRLRAFDAQYIQEVKIYNKADAEAKAFIESEKKGLLKQELDKQLDENEQKKRDAEYLKSLDDQRHKDRIAHDNNVFKDNMERKRIQVQGHLVQLTQQARDKEAERRQAELDAKKPEGTGLHVPQKVKKCLNCAVCKRITALERLNKRYKIKKD